MKARILAALVALSVVIPVLIWGGELGVIALVSVVLLIGVDEYARMTLPSQRRQGWLGTGVPALVLYFGMVYLPEHIGGLAVLCFLWTLHVALFRPEPVGASEDRPHVADAAGRMLLGGVWIGLGLGSLPLLRGQGLGWLLVALFVVWLADSGAYFAGRALGRHKLYEKISPKKTWEGVVGGVIVAVAGVELLRRGMQLDAEPVSLAVLTAVLSLLGVTGDLVQSMLKRSFGVKDSGAIMPGHGGVLDRVDSLLFVGPALLAYLRL